MDRAEKCRAIDENAAEIYIRLRSYIGFMTSVRGLPPGYSNPDEIIHEAIARLLSGSRSWSPDVQSVVVLLTGIVRSLLSEEKGLYARERRKPLGRTDPEAEPEPEAEKDLSLSPEEARERWDAVKKQIGDDKELLDYVEARRLGLEKPAEIAEATGFPIERIYELPRKLMKLAPAIRKHWSKHS
jgi:hypothetical protein